MNFGRIRISYALIRIRIFQIVRIHPLHPLHHRTQPVRA